MAIKLYTDDYIKEWNEFLVEAQNATFLFHRNYLKYHADRFEDHSLMYYEADVLVGILPANRNKEEAFSHQGLTYGSFIVQHYTDIYVLGRFIQAVTKYLYESGIKTFYYKEYPSFYMERPMGELPYLLSLMEAKVYRTDLTTIINLQTDLDFEGKRKKGIKRSRNLALVINDRAPIAEFWEKVLTPLLEDKHEVKPVHTAQEMAYLQSQFPNHIQQFSAYEGDEIVAGVTIYEDRNVAHTQYIAATQRGKQIGALDYLLNYLINEYYSHLNYFSFGISTTALGKQLNKGLLDWKKGFDGSHMALRHYEIATKHFSRLKDFLPS